MQHNPNAPTVIGEEFRPAVANTLPNYRVASTGDAVVQRLDSTVTESVGTVGLLVAMDTAAGSFLAETLIGGSEIPGAVTTTVLRPSAVVNDGALIMPVRVQPEPGATNNQADILALIQRATIGVSDEAHYIHFSGSHTPGSQDQWQFDVRFPTAGAFTGKRITDVRVMIDGVSANLLNPTIAVLERFAGGVQTTWSASDLQLPSAAGHQILQVSTKEVRPHYNRPWSQGDLTDFATAGPGWVVTIFVANVADSMDTTQIYRVWMEVDTVPDDRLSADIVTPGATGIHWVRYTPHDSTGAAGLTKTNGVDLTTVIRQARYGDRGRPTLIAADYTLSVPYIQGSNPTPPPGLIQYPLPTLATDGRIVDLGVAAGNRTVAVDYRIGSTGSVDAQSYARVEPVPLDASEGLVTQNIGGASTSNYAGVIVPCRLIDGGGGDTSLSYLTVEVRRLSDAHLMAAGVLTFDTAVATFPSGTGSWHVLQVPFSTPAALTSGIDYYITLIETGPGDGGHFSAAAFITDEDFTGAGLSPDGRATYLGTAYCANFNSTTHTNADFAAVAYIAYPTPAALAAFGDTIPMAEATDCAPLGVGVSRLSWTPYGSGTGFAYYEIQRSDEYTDWATIATLSNYARHTFVDAEGRLGIPSSYRIRGVATAGLMSDWSAISTATAPETGCGYTFTSNVTNNVGFGTMLAYADLNPGGALAERSVTFPEATEIKRQAIYGRPMFVSFVPADRRGDEFTRNLYLNGIVNPDTPPPSDAAPLRDMTRDPRLPYLCVRDDHGQRWFANVNVTDYLQRNPGEFQTVHVTISESIPSATPYAPAL